MKYDLAIAHRVCPTLSTTAVGFSSKIEMVKATTESLAIALSGLSVKLIIILDGCPSEYEDIFLEKFPNHGLVDDTTIRVDMVIIKTPSIGNQATWARQIDELLSVTDAPYLYFSEDDYLYKPFAFYAMIDFLNRNSEASFCTPLDHPDRYRRNIVETQRVSIEVSPYCHWREASTTCLTFMMRRECLPKVRRMFYTFVKGNIDGTMWFGITKDLVFNVPVLLKAAIRYFFCRNADFGRMLPLAAWKWHGIRLLWSRRYRLWSPLPTLAIHLSSVSLPLSAECFMGPTHAVEKIKSIAERYLFSGFEDV